MQYALDRDMKVNKTTMLFEDLSDEEATHIKEIAKSIVMIGHIYWENLFVKMWLAAVYKNDNQKLLMAIIQYGKLRLKKMLI